MLSVLSVVAVWFALPLDTDPLQKPGGISNLCETHKLYQSVANNYDDLEKDTDKAGNEVI